jgi:hypothetical protein
MMQEWAKASVKNRSDLEYYGVGYCYHCLGEVWIKDIEEWTDNNLTASCPHCAMETVMPGIIDEAKMREYREEAFGE